jgi:hypothetical protein
VKKDTLYKYRSWFDNNHKKSLTKNELYFAAPNDLNDPFDTKIPMNFSNINTLEKVNRLFEIMFEKTPPEFKSGINKEAARTKFINDYSNGSKTLQRDYNRVEFERFNYHHGVMSFSLRIDNILMWSHYANNHRGFCLGFHRGSIEKAQIGISGVVQYRTKFPNIDPLNTNETEKIIHRIFFKAKGWKYEAEYRIANIEFPNELNTTSRKFNYEDRFLKEIVLGLKIPEPHKQTLIKIARKKKIPIYQMVQRPMSFSLRKVLIS